MHILEIPSFFPPYGGLFCLEQSKALANQGHTVRIIANLNVSVRLSPGLWLHSRTRSYDVVMDGIQVTRREMRAIPFCLKHNVERWYGIVGEMADEYIKRYGKPDVLHAHCCAWAGYAAMLVSRKHNIPYVVTEHLASELHLKQFGKDGVNSWQVPLLRESLESANRVILVSEELAADLAPLFGSNFNWQAVSNTIDTDLYAYKKRLPLDGRPFTICCLAIFIPLKGYDILYKAFAEFIQKYNTDAQLLVAGAGTNSKEMMKLVDKYGIGKHVKLYGELDRNGVLDILYQSDCLALATRNEAQGLVLLEAMSTGIQVVTTDRTPKNVHIEGGCLIAPYNRADIMAERFAEVMHNTGFDGKAVSDSVKSLVSPNVIGRQLADVFESVVSKHQAQGSSQV